MLIILRPMLVIDSCDALDCGANLWVKPQTRIGTDTRTAPSYTDDIRRQVRRQMRRQLVRQVRRQVCAQVWRQVRRQVTSLQPGGLRRDRYGDRY